MRQIGAATAAESDGHLRRSAVRKNLAVACLVSAAGLASSIVFASLVPALIGITLGVIGLSSVRPAFYSLPSRYLTGAAAAGGIAFINSVGSLGGYVGPWVVGVLKGSTQSFAPGMLAMSVMLVVAALLAGCSGPWPRRFERGCRSAHGGRHRAPREPRVSTRFDRSGPAT